MARNNYSQIKRQKEATRKLRQQTKLERRTRKEPDVPGPGATETPAAPGPASPANPLTP